MPPGFFTPTVALTSTDESDSVFRDKKLRPGVYKIQNIVGQTYVNIRGRTIEFCGQPATTVEGKEPVRSRPCLAHRRNSDHPRASVKYSPMSPDIRGYLCHRIGVPCDSNGLVARAFRGDDARIQGRPIRWNFFKVQLHRILQSASKDI